MRLTESSISRLQLGNRKERYVRDDKVTGFAVRLRWTESGVRRDFCFVWQETRAGKRVTRKAFIGEHGNPWTLEQARAEAGKLLLALESNGKVESSRKAARAERTIADLWKAFEEKHLPTLKPKSQVDYRYSAEKRILPKLGRDHVSKISRGDVIDWHAGMKATPIAANRALAALSKMMAFAVEREWRSDNPCTGVRKNKESARDRWLDELELPAFLKALGADTSPHGDLLRFLTVTGWRVSEALGLTWEVVDPDRLVARLADTKTGAQVRALSGDAMRIVAGQRHRRGYVFSSRGGAVPLGYKQVREALQAVCAAAGIAPLRPHDLRHTAASWAAIGGAGAHELREAFGWKTLAMTGRYVGRAETLGRRGVERAASAIGMFAPRAGEAEPASAKPEQVAPAA